MRMSFFGVYDGHGGRKAVEYVVENLHTNVFNTLGDFDDRERGEAIKAAFLKTDQEFLKQGVCSGSCCVTALIEKEIIVVSNLGDCRAVLSRGGIAETLTNDHTASRVDEQERIKKKGGCIEDHNGAWRVQGILAVTRSIGDIHLKDWILAEPDTVVVPLVSDMEFLILASDGLWNKVGNQEAVDVAIQIHNGKNNVRTKTDVEADENLFGCENTSPPAKLRKTERVAIQIHNGKSIVRTKSDADAEENVFGCENTSPPAKLRKIGRVKEQKAPHCPGKELDRTESPGLCSLTIACKRLATIATTRGSLDDITVMIIDLSHFLIN